MRKANVLTGAGLTVGVGGESGDDAKTFCVGQNVANGENIDFPVFFTALRHCVEARIRW